MEAPRNIPAALAVVRDMVRSETRHSVSLSALEARARSLNAAVLVGIDPAEFRELLELALAPNATVPTGAAGEAAIAYLVAFRDDRDPVAEAHATLARFGAEDQVEQVAQWLRESGERALVQADVLAAHAATKWGPQ